MEKTRLAGPVYTGRRLAVAAERPIVAPTQKRTNNEQFWAYATQLPYEEIPEADLYPSPSDPRFAQGQRYAVFLASCVALDPNGAFPDIVPNAVYCYDDTIPHHVFNRAYREMGTDQSPAYLERALQLAQHKPRLRLLHVTTGLSTDTNLPLIGLGFMLA